MSLLTEDARKQIESLFLRYGPGVGSYVLSRVGNAELAEEITARVFLAVVRSYRPPIASPVGWLWSIVRTELSRHYRNRPLQAFPHDVAHGDPTPGESLESKEQAELVRDAMGKLTEEEQELVSLKFYLGLGNQEIAQALGISANHVGVKLHRALRTLRVLLERSLSP
jgi:RNA polymerase sigma-70 factor (ECF subfamily)